MTKTLLVMLTVEVDVDDDYSPRQHAEDILANTRRLLAVANVEIASVDTIRQGLENLPRSQS